MTQDILNSLGESLTFLAVGAVRDAVGDAVGDTKRDAVGDTVRDAVGDTKRDAVGDTKRATDIAPPNKATLTPEEDARREELFSTMIEGSGVSDESADAAVWQVMIREFPRLVARHDMTLRESNGALRLALSRLLDAYAEDVQRCPSMTVAMSYATNTEAINLAKQALQLTR